MDVGEATSPPNTVTIDIAIAMTWLCVLMLMLRLCVWGGKIEMVVVVLRQVSVSFHGQRRLVRRYIYMMGSVEGGIVIHLWRVTDKGSGAGYWAWCECVSHAVGAVTLMDGGRGLGLGRGLAARPGLALWGWGVWRGAKGLLPPVIPLPLPLLLLLLLRPMRGNRDEDEERLRAAADGDGEGE